jgi:glutathione S-transferase
MHSMKLFFNQTSPYARKVRVVVAEKGLGDAIEMIDVDPWAGSPELLAVAPLSKVPALVTAAGMTITESDTIVRYLDEIRSQPRMFPEDQAARADAYARMALAQGMTDAAFDSVLERRRAAGQQSEVWVSRQHAALERGLAVAACGERPNGRFDLGDVSLACLLAYLDFRLPRITWRDTWPSLAAWQDVVAKRASMLATQPR